MPVFVVLRVKRYLFPIKSRVYCSESFSSPLNYNLVVFVDAPGVKLSGLFFIIPYANSKNSGLERKVVVNWVYLPFLSADNCFQKSMMLSSFGRSVKLPERIKGPFSVSFTNSKDLSAFLFILKLHRSLGGCTVIYFIHVGKVVKLRL